MRLFLANESPPAAAHRAPHYRGISPLLPGGGATLRTLTTLGGGLPPLSSTLWGGEGGSDPLSTPLALSSPLKKSLKIG